MASIYYEKLSPQVKKKMRNKDYLLEELEQIQQEIRQGRLVKIKSFKRLVLIMSIILVLMVGLTYMSAMKMPNVDMMAINMSVVFTPVLFVCILVFIKFLAVDLIRNQFIHQIKRNYPEYINYFKADSFK